MSACPLPMRLSQGSKGGGVLGEIRQGRVLGKIRQGRVLGKIRHGAKVYLSGEALRWRVCHRRGLPRLVFDLQAKQKHH